MRYRRFGKTGWQVSEISLGGAWFYGRAEMGLLPPAHGIGVVHRALELGVNYFDTAPLYGRGRSEEILGAALRGVEQPYYLATKVGYYPEPFDYTRDTVWRGFEASLKRLGRDHVHLLQLHEAEKCGWERLVAPDGALAAMREIREQGLCDYLGLTGSDLDLMTRMLDGDEWVSVLTFLKYDLLDQSATARLLPAATQRDMAVIAASPLHGGLLGSTRDHWVEQGRFPELHDKLRRLEALAEDAGESVPELGLDYLLADDRVTTVLCGAADITELEACVAASERPRPSDELRVAIEAL